MERLLATPKMIPDLFFSIGVPGMSAGLFHHSGMGFVSFSA
jgi:hypothetical protein